MSRGRHHDESLVNTALMRAIENLVLGSDLGVGPESLLIGLLLLDEAEDCLLGRRCVIV